MTPNDRDEDDDNDLDRKAILARRNRFIAVALTGLSTALSGCEKKGTPQPCLDVRPPKEGRPEPCLEIAVDPDEDQDDDQDEADDEGQPLPCLSPLRVEPNDPPLPADPPTNTTDGDPAPDDSAVAPEPRPHACLMVVAPEPDEPDPNKPDKPDR